MESDLEMLVQSLFITMNVSTIIGMKTHLINMPNEQLLEIVTVGEPHSTALVFHHGALGSSENMAPLFREAQSRGIFAIGITRPGYSGSTRREGRRTNDYFLETRVAINHFQVEKFVSLGWSSGSPAAISDTQDNRCVGAITIAGDAPRVSADWQSYIEKYPPNNGASEDFEMPSFDTFRSCSAEQLIPLFGSALSQRDIETCKGGASEELAVAMRRGMAPGDFGALDDFDSDGAAWGIDLGKVSQPVAVFQGDEDRMCTPAHGHFLADNLENAQLIMEIGEGHISLMYNKSKKIIDTAVEFLNHA
jgi:pimeloyl-ACP methyl ester carboxylesterase